jgi:hypothetical protein
MGENHEPDEGKLQQAEKRLEEAETDLKRARSAEVRAEHAIEKAAEEIERLEETEKRRFEIIVNGRPKTVERKTQSYRDIARLAYPDADFGQFLYTITFFNGVDGQEGDLVEGEIVKVKEGMVFNVRRSDKS